MTEEHEYYAESVCIIGHSSWGDVVQSVICKLPINVAKWVASRITFIDVSGLGAVSVTVPSTMLIVFGEFVESDRNEFVVSHEIAHRWLTHPNEFCNRERYEQAEREADKQANMWGFPGESIRVGHVGHDASDREAG